MADESAALVFDSRIICPTRRCQQVWGNVVGVEGHV